MVKGRLLQSAPTLRSTDSSNSKLRDELLNRKIFATLTEARILIADQRKE